MVGSLAPSENVDANLMLEKHLDASQYLLVSIRKHEDMVKMKQNGFQLFLEEKIIRHHVGME